MYKPVNHMLILVLAATFMAALCLLAACNAAVTPLDAQTQVRSSAPALSSHSVAVTETAASSSPAAMATDTMASPSPSATAALSETRTDDLGRFQTVDLSGNSFDYTMFYKNKLTMVNVWMTWCGPCVKEMPDLEKLSTDYADKGLAVVGILGDSVKSFDNPVRDDTAVSEGLQIMQKAGVTYTVLQPDQILCKTMTSLSSSLNNHLLFPTTFFVDSNGKTVDVVMGGRTFDKWKSEVDKLLAGE